MAPAVRVAFLTQDLQLSGGVGVVLEHASRLAADHGFDVTLVHTGSAREDAWSFPVLDGMHVVPLDEARGHSFDVAVATWWETTTALFELGARRYAAFVQSLEDRFYASWAPERLAASSVVDLPVRFVSEARWIVDLLDGLHPGTRALYVRNGVAKEVFRSPPEVAPALSGPLRIVVEGSRAVGFKGVDAALEATRRMREPRHVTLITPDGTGAGADGADEAVGPLSAREMAAALSEAHVLLKLSRVEGMAGPPLEAFHMGATAVTTPVTGHDEYVEHGANALVVDWDDLRGTARALDLLARDRAYLHGLRCGALATARGWPSWRQQSTVMAAALRTIASEPPPSHRTVGHRLVRDVEADLGHGQRRLIAYNTALDQLGEVRAERAYRWGVRARDALMPAAQRARGLRARLRRD